MPLAASTIWAVLRSPAARWIGVALVVSLLAWRGYLVVFDRGVDACEARHALSLAASIERAQAQAREIALQDAEILYQGTTERERIRNVYRDREIEIVKHVPPDCNACRITPAGVGLLNQALGNAPTTPPGPGVQPDPVPGPAVPNPGRQPGGTGHLIDGRDWKVL